MKSQCSNVHYFITEENITSLLITCEYYIFVMKIYSEKVKRRPRNTGTVLQQLLNILCSVFELCFCSFFELFPWHNATQAFHLSMGPSLDSVNANSYFPTVDFNLKNYEFLR